MQTDENKSGVANKEQSDESMAGSSGEKPLSQQDKAREELRSKVRQEVEATIEHMFQKMSYDERFAKQ